MATYIIGDLQGCLTPLLQLLEKIHYQPGVDQLLFTGDLVNRGPQSLATLRFVKSLPSDTITVLGNHDLSLLVASQGHITLGPKDTMQQILEAADKEELLTWLRHRPLMHHDPARHFILTHAGLYPDWTITEAQQYAHEVEAALQKQPTDFLANLFGDTPNRWTVTLSGHERLRFIVNAFTRMRFLESDGKLNLTAKGHPFNHPDLIPWFKVTVQPRQQQIIFGHWAALMGDDTPQNIHALDTGCVWGNQLTALHLETGQKIKIDCQGSN